MQGQIINNWNDLYCEESLPPWEDLEANQEFVSLISAHCQPGMKVLEVGAGLGHNALALAKLGVDVCATDYSVNAVTRCAKMANMAGVELHARCLDIMEIPEDFDVFDLVFDKGCWHTFFDRDTRQRFVEQVCHLLVDGGLWINSTGSADTNDDPNDSDVATYPRWTLADVVGFAEPYFNILQVRSGLYGYHEGRRFLTWESVFRKRANKANSSDR